jgi:hypothetical protein
MSTQWYNAKVTGLAILLWLSVLSMVFNGVFTVITMRCAHRRGAFRKRGEWPAPRCAHIPCAALFYLLRSVSDMLAIPAYYLLVVHYMSEFNTDILQMQPVEFLLHVLAIFDVFAVGIIYATLSWMRCA